MNRAKKNKDRLLRTVAADPALLGLFQGATQVAQQEAFARAVAEKMGWEFAHRSAQVDYEQKFFPMFNGWCGWRDKISEKLRLARVNREIAVANMRKERRNFLDEAGVTPGAVRTADSLPRIYVRRCNKGECYPPLGYYVAESTSISERWFNYHSSTKQPDRRVPRKPIHILDAKQLQADIGPDDSCLLIDEETGELCGAALRDFCPLQGAVDSLIELAEHSVAIKKSVRLEDPGKIVLMGYSAGARSRLCFGWAKNHISCQYDPQGLESYNYATSSAFAFFWNMCRRRLPLQVINDIQAHLRKTGITRMDGNGQMSNPDQPSLGHYTLNLGEIQFTINDAELAPPSGVFACNYCRAIHFEHQPHEYAISWTLSRNAGSAAAGHFYISQYRVRIHQAKNTVIVWKPVDAHGTSLPDVDPADKWPSFRTVGMAFITSPRIVSAWQKYAGNPLKLEKVESFSKKAAKVHYDWDCDFGVCSHYH